MALTCYYWCAKRRSGQNPGRRVASARLAVCQCKRSFEKDGRKACYRWPHLCSLGLTQLGFCPLPQYPLTVVMLFSADLYSLLNFLSFARWLFIGLAVAGLIYLRYKRPDMHRPFKVSSATLIGSHRSVSRCLVLPSSYLGDGAPCSPGKCLMQVVPSEWIEFSLDKETITFFFNVMY